MHLPRGYRLITAQEIPGQNRLFSLDADIPLLSAGRLSYFGEPVALLVGPDPSFVAELAASVELRWEEDEPYYGELTPDASQVAAVRTLSVGEPDIAFEAAASMIESEYRSSSLEHFYSEPQGALAYFDYDKIVVRTATQWPQHVRESVGSALGCREEEIRILPTRLGIHLDGKLWYPSLLACHAALAARLCRAPARILFTREEDFRYSPKGARSSISLRGAVDAQGRISALDVRIAIDMGAYGPFAMEMLSQACVRSLGAYSCPNIHMEGIAFRTNTPPAGAFAGLGAGHAFLALESLTSRLAESIGEDPMEWKSRNLLGKLERFASGTPLKEAPPSSVILTRLSSASDFRRKHSSYELVRKRRASRDDSPLRGIGFSFAYQGEGSFIADSSHDSYSVEVVLEKDLRLTIRTGAPASRGGVVEVWRQEAATILAIPEASIDILPQDTEITPESGPVTLSRSVSVISRLVESACTSIQRRRFREPLPLAAKKATRIAHPLKWTDAGFDGSPFEAAAWGGAVVEVELDPWTLEPRPIGIWLCVDGGLILAPERARQALRSATIDALGASSSEAIRYVDGRIEAGAYYAYSLAIPRELPEIDVQFIERGRQSHPRGIGELPFDLIPAAFLSAISQAAGYPVSSLPVLMDQVIPELEIS